MKLKLISLISLLALINALPSNQDEGVNEALTRLELKRQSSDSYAPWPVECPYNDGFIRTGQDLSQNETDYINGRLENVKEPMRNFLNGANLSYNLDDMFNNSTNIPRLGLAISGGGYRAALGGAGFLAALDNRNDTLDLPTQGLLQSALYATGLSGGSWVLTSFSAFDMESPWSLNDNIWRLEDSLWSPGILQDFTYYHDLISDVLDKKDAGFETQITDFWGRALSYHFLNDNRFPNTGQSTTFSGAIRNQTSFKEKNMPYPIILSVEREDKTLTVDGTSAIFEMSPYEWGTFSTEYSQFVPIEYVGTDLNDNSVNGTCYMGLENAGFTFGSSATLFNAALLQLQSSGSQSTFNNVVQDLLGDFSETQDDVALWKNPFVGFESDRSRRANNSNIALVDGGEALENIPLWPHLKPEREVDLVLAFDSSADTTSSFPNGTSLYATYNHSLHDAKINSPEMPTADQMVAQGLNTRPTFFGCDAENNSVPIIAYIPSYPYVYNANQSTYKLQYDFDESSAMIANGMASMSLNGLVDDWKQCLGCALVKRSVDRMGLDQSSECQKCFTEWCWNSDTVDTSNVEDYEPGIPSTPSFVQSKSNGNDPAIEPYHIDSGVGSIFSKDTLMVAVIAVAISSLLLLN